MAVLLGKDHVVQVSISGTMTYLAQQRGCTLDENAEPIDTTVKDNLGHRSAVMGLQSTSIQCSGLIPDSDAAYQALLDGYKARTQFTVEIKRLTDLKVFKINAWLTAFPKDFQYEEAATYECTFTADGAPTKYWENP